MIGTDSISLATRRPSGQSLSSRLRRRISRLVPSISAPVFCLGLPLLALVPLLLE